MTKILLCAIATTAAAAILSLALNAGQPDECYDKSDPTYAAALKQLTELKGQIDDIEDVDNYGNRICTRKISFANSGLSDKDVETLVQLKCLDTVFQKTELKGKFKEINTIHFELNLSFTSIKGTCLAALRNVKCLQELHLSHTLIYDQGIGDLKHIPALEYVVLDYNYMPLSSIRLLVGDFRETGKDVALSFAGIKLVDDEAEPEITPAGCRMKKVCPKDLLCALAPLSGNLVGLDLGRLELVDNDVALLRAQFPNMKWLELRNNKLTNVSLRHIQELTGLWWLNLAGNANIVDPDLDRLNKLNNTLKFLGLGSTGITNRGLERLRMPRLESLDISDTGTTLDDRLLESMELIGITPQTYVEMYKNRTKMTWKEAKDLLKKRRPAQFDYDENGEPIPGSDGLRLRKADLHTLNVAKTGVSDDEIEAFQSLVGLRNLDVKDTVLKFQSIDDFMKSRWLGLILEYPDRSAAKDSRLRAVNPWSLPVNFNAPSPRK